MPGGKGKNVNQTTSSIQPNSSAQPDQQNSQATIQKADDQKAEDAKPQTPADPSQFAQSPTDIPREHAEAAGAAQTGGMSPRSRRWADRRVRLTTTEVQHIVSYKNEDRCVLALRDEANAMRQRERQWAMLQAELHELENSFDSVWNHKKGLEADFKSKQLNNVSVIQDMRNQVSSERNQNANLKSTCVDRYRENDEQRLRLDELLYEVSKHKCDFDREKTTNEHRQFELKHLTAERDGLNESNSADLMELTRLAAAVSKQEAECKSLTVQGDGLDSTVKHQHQMIDDLTMRVVDKSNELSQKDQELMGCNAEIHHLNEQIAQFESHVAYLKSCQEKTTQENTDIQGRIDAESAKNSELTSIIRDIEIKIKAKEDQVTFLCNSINSARQVNATSLDNNSNLQAEMEGISNHINVISAQNKALSVELDTFSAANEAMRMQLDRRHRVAEVMEQNDHTIAHSSNYVEHTKVISRSPVRHQIVEARPATHGFTSVHSSVAQFGHRVVEEKRTPVEWRVERSIERRHVGDRIERVPVHPAYHTYSKSFVSTGPGMTQQTDEKKGE